MATIWKFPLSLVPDYQGVQMPAGSRLLAVQLQREFVVLWAIVQDTAPMVRREIARFGTGEKLPPNPGEYIGTVQVSDGHLVWHYFDQGSR